MALKSPTEPWGVSRLAPYVRTVQLPFTDLELDPQSQATRYFDAAGQAVEMGKHGTSRDTAQATATGSDGAEPSAPVDSDVLEDSESD
ncbi:putative ATP-grasp-modified RiPP [Streptomyces sp. NPDC026206]|uniref:putative ATP-grasp-modified RiPP n=1 Tax=Streptomyces sp. NPDC026206 TaxID=3157089 RepID=UPI0033F16714